MRLRSWPLRLGTATGAVVLGIAGLLVAADVGSAAAPAGPAGRSLRFFGTGADDVDRVKIPLEPPSPIDVGGDLTLEFWLRAEPGANSSGACEPSNSKGDAWINGNIVVDRDVFFGGDLGDYGLSLYGADGGVLAFGVAVGEDGGTLCGGQGIGDGQWHHVAATRRAAGAMRLFVDGRLVAEGDGPSGDIGYRNGRDTDYPNSDPYLVLGAEKHDAGSDYPSFHGWLDELRISNSVRYDAAFAVPTEPFVTDAATVGLYHMDEGGGEVLGDDSSAAGGPSNGQIRVGGPSNGPVWEAGAPLGGATTTTAPPTTGAPTGSTEAPTTPPPTSAASTTNAPASSPPPSSTPSTTIVEEASSSPRWPLALGIGAGIAALSAAVVLVARARRSGPS